MVIVERQKAERQKEMKRYLLSPVTNVTQEEAETIEAWVVAREAEGHEVHLPWRDVDQEHLTGWGCCCENLEAMEKADIIDIYWNPTNSPGSIFDLGMAFAMGKQWTLINSVETDNQHSLEQLIKTRR